MLDREWHVTSQLLAMQHELLVSITFLVNLMLLLLDSVGYSLPGIIANSPRYITAILILSFVAYIGIAATTIGLVALHTTLEGDPDAQNERVFDPTGLAARPDGRGIARGASVWGSMGVATGFGRGNSGAGPGGGFYSHFDGVFQPISESVSLTAVVDEICMQDPVHTATMPAGLALSPFTPLLLSPKATKGQCMRFLCH